VTTVERIHDRSGAQRWLALANLCVPVDHPGLIAGSLNEVLHQLSGEQESAKYAHFVAVDDGVDVAYGTARLPLRDNLSGATISLSVLPSWRRQGVGGALVHEILDFAKSEGRTRVGWAVSSPLGEESPGCQLSRALGAQRVLSRHRRELELADVDDERLDALVTIAKGRDDNYQILSWADRAPDDLVDGVARLVGRMSTDTPRGDSAWEAEVWDGARWREKEHDALRSGRRRLATGAVDLSGNLVAFTDIGVWAHEPSVAEQWNTIVEPDHRGHRLGLAVKVANLRHLQREVPGARRLETVTAFENSRMIAINELLGFQIVERVDEFQLSL
jgi:GNAT superfamily N-acetyltransferase